MKVIKLILILVILSTCNCHSQDYLSMKSYKSEGDCRHILDDKYGKIYTIPNKEADFKNTILDFLVFVTTAYDDPEQGRIALTRDDLIDSFREIGKLKIGLLIDSLGNIVSFTIKGPSLFDKDEKNYTPLEKFVAKRIPMSPKWTPAQCNGRDVTSYLLLHYNMPRIK